MRKTITITDPMQVKVRDKAYVKDCDFGFTVTKVDADDKHCPFAVYDPLSRDYYWIHSSQFDHATREVDEPEWPAPHDVKLHVYLGADGKRYIYNPTDKGDALPWSFEGGFGFYSRDEMETDYHDALPLIELRLVAYPEKHTTRSDNA